MPYVIGVDGGQSSTTALVMNEMGAILGVGRGGPANHIHEPGGVQRVQRSLQTAIGGAISQAELNNARIALTCLGMTGASEEMESLCASVVPSEELLFGQDTRIALFSVTAGQPGAVIIAGTGSAALCITAEGVETAAGGWGYLMGDEGSGYWIGLRALNACTRSEDGRDPPTKIYPLLRQFLEVENLKQIHSKVYSGRLGRPEIAALSEMVSEAAGAGDHAARNILRDAGYELARIVASAIVRADMAQRPIMVGTTGGVFKAGRPLLQPFRSMVLKTAPLASIKPARVPAAAGAALMALSQLGIDIHEQLMTNLISTLSRFGPVKS